MATTPESHFPGGATATYIRGVTVEEFLAPHDEDVRRLALDAIAIVLTMVPDAIVRVHPGWRLVGFRKPLRRGSRYFAFVAPLEREVRLGFEHGRYLRDPDGVLRGDGTQVRYVPLVPGDAIRTAVLERCVREALSVSLMNRELRSEICRAT